MTKTMTRSADSLDAYCERAGLVRIGQAARMLGVERWFIEDLISRGHMTPVEIPWGNSGRLYATFYRSDIETLQARIRIVGLFR